MTPERWAELRRIFGDVLDLPPSKREAYAAQACAGDTQMLEELQRLLSHHEQSGQILDHPPSPPVPITLGSVAHAYFRNGELIAGRYRIVRMLGSGGMGEVYEAFDTMLNCNVALKSLRAEVMNDPIAAARLRREVQTARQVTHPNVCRIYDLVRHERPELPAVEFVSMELLHGRTLQAMLSESGPLTTDEAMPLIRGIVDGLSAAHAAGIVHRDLKSANIMLDQTAEGSPRPVIMDFGLASGSTGSSQSQTVTGPLAGTPAYMAPEQFEGHRATSRSDIYSLGVIIFELVTGRQPFEAESPIVLALKRLTERPTSPRTYAPRLPLEWEHAILRCLALAPEARYAHAADVLAALETPPKHLWAHRIRSWIPARMTPRAWTLAAVALMVAAGSVWFAAAGFPYQPEPEALRWYMRGMSSLSDGAYAAARAQFAAAVKIDNKFALAHARLAQSLDQLDHGNEARQAMLTALAAASQTNLGTRERELLEALHHSFARDQQQAVTRFRELAANATGDEKVQALLDLGHACDAVPDIECAIQAYSEVINIDPDLPAAHYWLASRLARSGQAGKAKDEAEKALQLYERLNNFSGVAQVLLLQAEMLTQQRLLAEARQKLDRALEIAKATASTSHQVRTLLHMSVLVRNQGNTEQAQRLAAEATRLAEENQLQTTAAQGLIDLGNAELVAEKHDRAEQHYNEALRYARPAGGRRAEARALISLGSVRVQQHRGKEALAFIKPALAYYKEGAFDRQYRQGLTLLARAEAMEGNGTAAIETLRELVRSAQTRGNPAELADAHGRLGSVLLDFERFHEAERELALSQVNSGPNRKPTLMYQALRVQALSKLGRLDEAKDLLARLSTNPEVSRGAFSSAEQVYLLSAARINEALPKAKRMAAVPTSSAYFRCSDLLRVAEASLVARQTQDAAEAIREAQQESVAAGDLQLNAKLRYLHSWLLLQQRQLAKAAEEGRAAAREANAVGMPETTWLACQVGSQAVPGSDRNQCEPYWQSLREQLGGNTETYLSRPDLQFRVSN